jgi:tetratricopeptide (TPR) repeat protein
MANILQFPARAQSKLGFQRVKKRKKTAAKEQPGQLNLFTRPEARIVKLPTGLSPFEEGLVLDERGDERASEWYRKAICIGDGAADAYCNLGILEFHNGSTEKAFDCFANSLKHDPRHLESHYNLANLYFEVGDLRLAKTHYEMAAEVEPGFANIYFNLGLVHAMNDDYKAAISVLDKYQELASKGEGSKADELLDSLKRSVATQN